jgi:hypothetical protein
MGTTLCSGIFKLMIDKIKKQKLLFTSGCSKTSNFETPARDLRETGRLTFKPGRFFQSLSQHLSFGRNSLL